MADQMDVANWKVLIVDDDQDNLGVASEYLGFMGAMVRTAPDGEQGLSLLKEFKPTLILLDLSMPVMDGWQTLDKLREFPEMANVPVIALTAHAMEQDRDRAIEYGFDGYITKPFILTELVDDIKSCLTNTGETTSK